MEPACGKLDAPAAPRHPRHALRRHAGRATEDFRQAGAVPASVADARTARQRDRARQLQAPAGTGGSAWLPREARESQELLPRRTRRTMARATLASTDPQDRQDAPQANGEVRLSQQRARTPDVRGFGYPALTQTRTCFQDSRRFAAASGR